MREGIKTKGPKLRYSTGAGIYNWFTMIENVNFIKDVLITEIFCNFSKKIICRRNKFIEIRYHNLNLIPVTERYIANISNSLIIKKAGPVDPAFFISFYMGLSNHRCLNF